MFIRVVLPLPFSPSRERISPLSRVKSMASLATTLPKRLVMCRSSMAWTGSKAISSSQAPYLSLPPNGESSLIPLLVVSPSNPLRWALMVAPVFASSISLASAWRRKLSHSATRRLPIKPASLGFDGGPRFRKGCVSHFLFLWYQNRGVGARANEKFYPFSPVNFSKKEGAVGW